MINTKNINRSISGKEEKLSWADLQYYALTKIFASRHEGRIGEFKSGVTALEMILQGHKDDLYARDTQLIEHQREVIRSKEGSEVADIWAYDEKMKALSELLYRVNRGTKRIRQRLKGSNFVKELASKLLDGTGQNAFITGKPGSGKSYTGVAIALEVTKLTKVPFSMKHLVFSPQEFLDVYNDEELTPPGSVIIYDETGVTFNSKDTYDEKNKLFAKLLQTIRHRAILVIFTAPDLSNIALDGRKLLHWWLKTESIQKKEGICVIKPYTVEVNQRDGKILFPYPVYDGEQLTVLDVEVIPDKVSEAYEERAKQYKDDLALSTEIEYGLMQDNKVERLKEYAKLRAKGWSIKDACKEMKIHRNTGTQLEKLRKNTRLAQYAQSKR